MARKKRVDGLASQAHIVCGVWNICLKLSGGYNPAIYWEVSQEGLADSLHIGRATAQRAISKLLASGCLTVEHGRLENGMYIDDNEPDEKRGKVPTRFQVTKEQLLQMAVRLDRYKTGMIMIQDPSGWIHLGYRHVVQESIETGLVVPTLLPTFARTDLYLYFSNEIEIYSETRKSYVPSDIALDEIIGT